MNRIISVLERMMQLYVFVFTAEKYALVNMGFLPLKTNVSEVSVSITESIQSLNIILEIFYFMYINLSIKWLMVITLFAFKFCEIEIKILHNNRKKPVDF